MGHDKKYDQRLQLRIDLDSYQNFEQMAEDLNVPFLHFCTLALGIGAKVLHRQTMAVTNIPDHIWTSMAAGFAQNMDEDKMMTSFMGQLKESPELLQAMLAQADEKITLEEAASRLRADAIDTF